MRGIATIWLGWDPREAAAFAVARSSLRQHRNLPIPIYGLVLDTLRAQGLYSRPAERRGGRLWDPISAAPMSTEFAISRFLVPHLAKRGWALFLDGDILCRADIAGLFELADPAKAVMVVKHVHNPADNLKMDGQVQTAYPRKNWSSCMLFNCDHPSNAGLTVGLVNSVPGRDLHRFCWLQDHEIGELPPKFNYLVGHTEGVDNPVIAHFTDGVPSMPGYESQEYADEWRAALARWAS